MDTLVADFRYAVRFLLSKPGTTVVALLTLGVGIGANTAIFSVVNSVLLRPLPYEEPSELVVLWQDLTRIDGPKTEWTTPDNFFDWRDQNETFESMFALGGWNPTLSGSDGPEMLSGAVTSFNGLATLGIEPVLGRGFLPEDDTASSERVVLLGQSLWQRRFGGRPDVVGETIQLDSEPATIIGVLPELEFPIVQDPEIFAPLRIDATNSCGRGCFTLRAIGRLKDGVSLESARADMAAIAARLERDYPDANTGITTYLVPLHEQLVGDMRLALWVLFGSVALVLLIACVNVANLLLSRAADREREVATRIAMGASPSRLVRQLLTESFLLAGFGAGLGLLLGLWGLDMLVSLVPGSLPRLGSISLDGRALLFTVLAALATGLLFGLAPALRASKPDLQGSLKDGGKGSAAGPQRMRSVLVVAEVALALALLVGASLLIRSFAALTHVDPGFDPEGVLTARITLVGTPYDETTRRASLVRRVVERVETLPGVESAGVIYALPMAGLDSDANFLIEGREPPRPQDTPVAWYRPATPGYFETMKMRLVRGRWFRDTDDAEATPVVLINEATARRYWPNEDPLQSRVQIGQTMRQVVGIVADTKHFGLDQDDRPAMYFPFDQLPLRNVNLVARTAGEPEALASSIRAAVAEEDPGLAVATVAPMTDVVSRTVAPPRAVTLLLSVFAASALLLAAVGLYGVMSYAVGQQTREIGIRMALGARSGDVLLWAVGNGMLLLAIGGALGGIAAFAGTRYLQSLLFATSATDPTAFVLSGIVLAAVALAACYLPARRAARIDPIVALRYE